MKNFNTGIGNSFAAKRREKAAGVAKPPLRSHKEMADEFGVASVTLTSLLAKWGGPKPALRTMSRRTDSAVWYDPMEMRKWWEDKSKGAAK